MTKMTLPKPKTIGISIVFIVVVAACMIGVSKASSGYLAHGNSREDKGCYGAYTNHTVIIQNGAASPAHTMALRCDTLTITNKDDVGMLIAFGQHDDHVPYDGVEERGLSKNQSLTVNLISTGNYRFHDHIYDHVQGTFTVTDKK
jgi:hypothetical protein